jgi:hypothetical protein
MRANPILYSLLKSGNLFPLFLSAFIYMQPVSAQHIHVIDATPHLRKDSGQMIVIPQVQVPTRAQLPERAPSLLSENGYAHTPKGNLHMLILYVGFNDATARDDIGEPYAWKHDTLPRFAMGDNNIIVSKDGHAQPQLQSFTNWFTTMSAGKFTVTGEIFWVTIDKSGSGNQMNFYEMYGRAFKALQQKYPDEDWGRFDKRHNNPEWKFDNTPEKSDGVIDYVVLGFRNINGVLGSGGCFPWLYKKKKKQKKKKRGRLKIFF